MEHPVPELGEYIEVIPPMKRVHEDWYQGTADAVFQNFQSIEAEAPEAHPDSRPAITSIR